MERRRRIKHRQGLIIGIVLVVIAAVFAIIAGIVLSNNRSVDESIFESSDNRLVISMNDEMASFEDSEYEPEITRIIYYHDGKNITKMEIYFEYKTEDEAKEANAKITLDGKDWATDKKLQGRFIVFDVAPGQYNRLSVEQMKDTIENMRAAGALLEETTEEPEEESESEEEVLE